MKPIELFIVDDHYLIIEGIIALMQHQSEIQVIGHAQNAVSCMEFLKRMQPDVIFLDINLPDKNGIEICKDIKSMYPLIKIIGLSTYNQTSYINDMLENGADGYLLKNATKEEMTNAIQTVMAKKKYLSKEVYDNIKNNQAQQSILTRREKDVLKLLAKGLTNTEISRQLFISITTVDTHRKHLLAKLEVGNTALLISKATQLGIILSTFF